MTTADLSRTRIAVGSGFFLQGLVFAAILTQIPGIQDKIGLSDGDVTAVSLIVAVLAGLGSVLAGMIAERRSSAVATARPRPEGSCGGHSQSR